MKTPYRIFKILNNNAVVSKDENGREIILLGTGIGFHNRTGSFIDPDRILNVYRLQEGDGYSRIETLINEIPFQCFEIAEKIIHIAKAELGKALNANVIIALADHINFAVTQEKRGTRIPNLISEEINRFYKEEYKIGLRAVDMVNKEYNVKLPRSEAASIAFHLINAESVENAGETTSIIKETGVILQIINSSLKMEIREDTLSYSRLVTHTKYFVKRVLTGSHDRKTELFPEVQFNEEDEQYIKISDCLNNIACHLKETYDYQMTVGERFYLLIHILAVMQTN